MTVDTCAKMGFLLRIIAKLVYYLHIIIPMILIAMITFDLAKVVISAADEKTKKDATSKIVKRFIYAIVIYLVPVVITLIFNALADNSNQLNKNTNIDTTPTSWISCWHEYYKL